jgi:hypothetical protein
VALSRPFAYNNTGSPISGTTQYGDLVVGNIEVDYAAGYGGVIWWGGPDEDLRYIIGNARPGGQPVPSGVTETAQVGFWGTPLGNKTEGAFLSLANYIGSRNGQPPFATANDAVTWLNANGYYTSYSSVTPTPTPTNTPTNTETPTRTPTPTPTPSNTPYPPDTYFFYLPEGATPLAPLNNGDLLFTTNSASEVGYNPNDAQEVVFNLTDKSGTSHPDYLDALTYGATVTMTQGSNTAILSGDSLMWGSYVAGYISGNYLELVQPSPNPFVSGSPINLVLTVNYPSTPTPTPTNTVTPTQTQTPTNTPTPSVTPEPVTGYSFNLVALPYNFPSSGNTIMNGAGGATSGTTDPNVLATGSRGIYWNSIDSNGVDRTDYFSGFTGQSITITMSQTGSTAIYSGDSESLKIWTSTDTGFVFGAGIGVPPVGTPSGTAVLIQSASTAWTLGLPVYISAIIN